VGTTESRPDVVIVGGGFAEVTAARELTMRGRSAVLVEARDRLGGRTYTSDHDGHAMELGGTWLHLLQPNVGAEISRNGVETETFPVLWAVARTCGGDANDAFLGQRSFA
jgi:monoamine oxidase